MGISSKCSVAAATRVAVCQSEQELSGGETVNCRKISLGESNAVRHEVIPMVNIVSPAGSPFRVMLNKI